MCVYYNHSERRHHTTSINIMQQWGDDSEGANDGGGSRCLFLCVRVCVDASSGVALQL